MSESAPKRMLVRISYVDQTHADEDRWFDFDKRPGVGDKLDLTLGRYEVIRVFAEPPRDGGEGCYLARVRLIRPDVET